MFIKTISGSLYEVDEDNKKIRRLGGIKDPTARQGKDGEFKEYNNIKMVSDPDTKTSVLLINWSGDEKHTITSPIVNIANNLDDLLDS